ncbi:MAG: 4Fe-4S dicluster domain-containing protein [Candidatus Bathyarchaeota archaeon]|nr:4Fe-4S dicluster domain-containing protein [Candidatus Bathyarchaeota archaeon]
MANNPSKENAKEETNRPWKVDPSFKYEVLKMPGGETLKACFQCGTCTSGCPIARITDSYRPNQIIRMVQLGMRERMLPSKTLWLCTACFTCVDRCPQEVEMESVLRVLKNLAVKEGYIPNVFKELGSNILETGSAYKISEFRIKEREGLELPVLPKTNLDDIKRLAEITGFDSLIKGERKDE